LARLIHGLPPPAGKLWDTATLRDFVVGIEAGKTPFSFTSVVKPSTVVVVGELRAQISYVIYAPQTGRSSLPTAPRRAAPRRAALAPRRAAPALAPRGAAPRSRRAAPRSR